MKIRSMLMTLTALMFASVAHGHAHVQKSEPANNSTLAQAPKNVVLEFNEAVQMTVLSLQKSDGPTQDLKPLPSAPAKIVTVPIPAVDAGSYIIKWRAAGDDGHVVNGKVLFTVAPAGK